MAFSRTNMVVSQPNMVISQSKSGVSQQVLQPITLREVELFEYDYSSKFCGFLISNNKNTKTPLIVAVRSKTIK